MRGVSQQHPLRPLSQHLPNYNLLQFILLVISKRYIYPFVITRQVRDNCTIVILSFCNHQTHLHNCQYITLLYDISYYTESFYILLVVFHVKMCYHVPLCSSYDKPPCKEVTIDHKVYIVTNRSSASVADNEIAGEIRKVPRNEG